jgi:tetratricopeptide (TPR) repeat protein
MDGIKRKQARGFRQQRIVVVFFGLLLTGLFLEIALRLGGFVFYSLQEERNLQAVRQKGAYRILCLGESTTAGEYPPFLEQFLNQSNLGVRFGVIDKGRGCTNTRAILSEVEGYLDEYQPDMVVAMMGCNDVQVIYYKDIPESDAWLFRHCRVYRFIRTIYMHILKKAGIKQGSEESLASSENLNSSSDDEESLKQAIQLNPRDYFAYAELGWLYRDQGKYAQAEAAFKKSIEFNPKNDTTYVELGRLYREEDYQEPGKYPQAEELFMQAIKLNPKNDDAYFELGRLYREEDYRDPGKYPFAEAALKKAVELNPKNRFACTVLGWLYLEHGKYPEAEAVLKKAMDLYPDNDKLWGAMWSLYENMGRPDLAEKYARKVDQVRQEDYLPITVKNYRRLKEILDRRQVRLVCVQYPMRSIRTLKKIFQDDPLGIVFVDNEKTFKDSVRQEGERAYFVDMFGGDFGHCTEKGNRLLARNIGEAVIKEVFKQRNKAGF